MDAYNAAIAAAQAVYNDEDATQADVDAAVAALAAATQVFDAAKKAGPNLHRKDWFSGWMPTITIRVQANGRTEANLPIRLHKPMRTTGPLC